MTLAPLPSWDKAQKMARHCKMRWWQYGCGWVGYCRDRRGRRHYFLIVVLLAAGGSSLHEVFYWDFSRWNALTFLPLPDRTYFRTEKQAKECAHGFGVGAYMESCAALN